MNDYRANVGKMLTIPLIPLRGMTILPSTVIHFDLNREKSVKALEYAMMGSRKLFLVSQKDAGAVSYTHLTLPTNSLV